MGVVSDLVSQIAYYFGKFVKGLSDFSLSILVGTILLFVYITGYRAAPAPGLLRYLRQVGAPRIEEVMISYSWEAGVSENARGLAQGLMKSGLGVWIDVMSTVKCLCYRMLIFFLL